MENQAEYLTAKQRHNIDFEKLNNISLLFWFVTVLLFFISGFGGKLPAELKYLGVFILILLVINALVNGTLSTPLNRYQVRVFWLVDFWLLAAFYPALKKISSYFRNQIT